MDEMDDKMNASLSAALALQEAQTRALYALLKAALNELGLRKLDGVPISEWVDRRQTEELAEIMIRLEDHNPAAGALVQQWVDNLAARATLEPRQQPPPS